MTDDNQPLDSIPLTAEGATRTLKQLSDDMDNLVQYTRKLGLTVDRLTLAINKRNADSTAVLQLNAQSLRTLDKHITDLRDEVKDLQKGF